MVANTSVLRHRFEQLLLAAIIFSVGLALGAAAVTARNAATLPAPVAADAASSVQTTERSLAASAARYNAMATAYTARLSAVALGRGRTADAARYTAMAARHSASSAAALARGRAADAARYNAMAAYYAAYGK